MTDAGLPPAGWYPDPADARNQRWWDGYAWTEHLRPLPAPVAVVPAYVEPANPYAVEPAAYQPMSGYTTEWKPDTSSYNHTPQGSPNTVGIWVLCAVYPAAYLVLLLAVFSNPTAIPPWAPFAVSAFMLILVVSAIIGDHLSLRRRGLPAASPLWMLLSLVAYLIVRRVTLKREGIRHNAPGNVFVLGLIACGIFTGISVPNLIAQQSKVSIESIEEYAETQYETNASGDWTVTCPDDAPTEVIGAVFICTASSDSGQTATFSVTVEKDRLVMEGVAQPPAV